MISYEPFFNMLKSRGISQYALLRDYNIGTGLLDKLRQNKPITLQTVEKLCNTFNCQPSDIFRYHPDRNSRKNSYLKEE